MKPLELLGMAGVLGLLGYVNGFHVQPFLRDHGVPGWLGMAASMVGFWYIGGSIGKATARTLDKRRGRR